MSSTTTTKRNLRIPAPIYAVAGASNYAYNQLRKLPAVAAELREELPQLVAEMRNEIPARVEQMRMDLTARRVPEAVNTLVGASVRFYAQMVSRGERVVNRSRRQTATVIAPEGEVVRKQPGPATRRRPAKKATKTTAKTTGRPAAKKATPRSSQQETSERVTATSSEGTPR